MRAHCLLVFGFAVWVVFNSFSVLAGGSNGDPLVAPDDAVLYTNVDMMDVPIVSQEISTDEAPLEGSLVSDSAPAPPSPNTIVAGPTRVNLTTISAPPPSPAGTKVVAAPVPSKEALQRRTKVKPRRPTR
jgi:hypothetical protein